MGKEIENMKAKLYYIKHDVIAQAERMREKLMYKKEVELYDLFMEGKYEEYKEVEDKVLTQLEELQGALDSVTSDRGCYNYKAEWKYVEVIKKYANQRNTLDSLIG
jgi:hypothetical protein